MAGRETIPVPRAELEHLRDELIALEQLFETLARKRVDVTMLRMRLDALLAHDPDKTPVRPPSGTWVAAAATEDPSGKR